LETAVASALRGLFSLKAACLVQEANAPALTTLKKKDPTVTVALVVNY